MRRSNSERLSDKQVARIEERRRVLGLSRVALREKFDQALREMDHKLGDSALKARFNRIFNRRMRRATSEENKIALAKALGWTLAEFDQAIHKFDDRPKPERKRALVETKLTRKLSTRQVALTALVQIETYQIGRGVDLGKDNLSRVYAAAYRMFGRLRELMSELPTDEFGRDGAAPSIYEALNNVLNTTLRSHLTKWPERYEEWRKRFAKSVAGEELSPQQLQQRFPQRRALERELKHVAQCLQADAMTLKKLIFAEKL